MTFLPVARTIPPIRREKQMDKWAPSFTDLNVPIANDRHFAGQGFRGAKYACDG
jgi:hypothetical protein